MKIEIDDTLLIDKIVKRVIEEIKPLLSNTQDSKSDELMDVEGLTQYLKVTKSWVYEKIYKKEIPYVKKSRTVKL